MTVEQLNNEMSNDEYVRWYIFFARKSQREEVQNKLARNRA